MNDILTGGLIALGGTFFGAALTYLFQRQTNKEIDRKEKRNRLITLKAQICGNLIQVNDLTWHMFRSKFVVEHSRWQSLHSGVNHPIGGTIKDAFPEVCERFTLTVDAWKKHLAALFLHVVEFDSISDNEEALSKVFQHFQLIQLNDYDAIGKLTPDEYVKYNFETNFLKTKEDSENQINPIVDSMHEVIEKYLTKYK